MGCVRQSAGVDLISGARVSWCREGELNPQGAKHRRILRTRVGSDAFGKFSTLFYFSTGYKSGVLNRYDRKCSVPSMELLQFNYSRRGTFPSEGGSQRTVGSQQLSSAGKCVSRSRTVQRWRPHNGRPHAKSERNSDDCDGDSPARHKTGSGFTGQRSSACSYQGVLAGADI